MPRAVLVGADKLLLRDGDAALGDDKRGLHHEVVHVVRSDLANLHGDGALKELFDRRIVIVVCRAVQLVKERIACIVVFFSSEESIMLQEQSDDMQSCKAIAGSYSA